MDTLLVLTTALVGLLLGPTLHGAGVDAGLRRSIKILPICESCGTTRRNPFARTHTCGAVRQSREPLWWGVSALLFGGAGWVTGWGWTLPAFLLFAALSVVLTITDLDHKLIPNAVLYPGGSTALALLALGAVADGDAARLPRSLGAGALYFLVLFAVALAARGGFGFGDVKLAALLGPFTAYLDFDVFLMSVFFTGVYGAIPALGLILFRRARLRDELPYGPAMILGAWTAIFGGAALVDWFRRL